MYFKCPRLIPLSSNPRSKHAPRSAYGGLCTLILICTFIRIYMHLLPFILFFCTHLYTKVLAYLTGTGVCLRKRPWKKQMDAGTGAKRWSLTPSLGHLVESHPLFWLLTFLHVHRPCASSGSDRACSLFLARKVGIPVCKRGSERAG